MPFYPSKKKDWKIEELHQSLGTPANCYLVLFCPGEIAD
jgi:hypothetical protein